MRYDLVFRNRLSLLIMKTFFIVPFFLIFINCERKETSQEIFNKGVKSLFKFEENDEEIILISKPAEIYGHCLEIVMNDTLTFNKSEIEQIYNQIENSVIKEWTDSSFENVKILDYDDWYDIFKGNLDKAWEHYHKKYGDSYLEISSPIFFNNYNYCLIFSAGRCGSLCGGGSFRLYKKTNGEWKEEKVYCNFIS